MPVLDGFSFSQSTTTTEVGLNEMQSTKPQTEVAQCLPNALEPAEWSFSTYAHLGKTTGSNDVYRTEAGTKPTARYVQTATEKHSGLSFSELQLTRPTSNTTAGWNKAVTRAAANMLVSSGDSNLAELGAFNLLCSWKFGANEQRQQVLSRTIYKLSNCVAKYCWN